MVDSEKTVSCTYLIGKGGEILPNAEIPAQTQIIDFFEQYIVGYTDDLRKHGKIPPEAAIKGATDKMYENCTWFQNPVNCISGQRH